MMGDNQNEFGGYDDDQNKPPADGKGLRKLYEDTLAKLTAAENRVAELEGQVTTRARGDLLKEAGVPEEAFEFYSGEATKEAVDAWVKAKGKLFGVDPEANAQPNPEAENLAAVQQAQSVGSVQGTHSVQTLQDDALAKINAGASEADVDAVLAKLLQP
jgi:hypothetical protein